MKVFFSILNYKMIFFKKCLNMTAPESPSMRDNRTSHLEDIGSYDSSFSKSIFIYS